MIESRKSAFYVAMVVSFRKVEAFSTYWTKSRTGTLILASKTRISRFIPIDPPFRDSHCFDLHCSFTPHHL
jgi:hypothetical protein